MINKKAKLNVRKPILFANCLSKCYLKYLGKKDGKNNIPFIDHNGKSADMINSPTINRELSKIEKCMSVVSEKINKKNNGLYKDTMISIIKFKQSALEYKRLHTLLNDKLKEYDIIIPNSYSLPEEEEMLNCKKVSEQELDPIGVRSRRFEEYQIKLKPLRQKLTESRETLKEQYCEIMINVKQIRLLDTYIDTSYIYYSSKVNKRISWYWQGVLMKHHSKKLLPKCPEPPKDSKLKAIHIERRKDFEDKLKELEETHKNILSMPEL